MMQIQTVVCRTQLPEAPKLRRRYHQRSAAADERRQQNCALTLAPHTD